MGQFWTPISLLGGSFLHADSHLRKLTRNRRIFPNDEAAFKALYLAIRQASRNWKPALQTFQLMFGEDRVPLNLVY